MNWINGSKGKNTRYQNKKFKKNVFSHNVINLNQLLKLNKTREYKEINIKYEKKKYSEANLNCSQDIITLKLISATSNDLSKERRKKFIETPSVNDFEPFLNTVKNIKHMNTPVNNDRQNTTDSLFGNNKVKLANKIINVEAIANEPSNELCNNFYGIENNLYSTSSIFQTSKQDSNDYFTIKNFHNQNLDNYPNEGFFNPDAVNISKAIEDFSVDQNISNEFLALSSKLFFNNESYENTNDSFLMDQTESNDQKFDFTAYSSNYGKKISMKSPFDNNYVSNKYDDGLNSTQSFQTYGPKSTDSDFLSFF